MPSSPLDILAAQASVQPFPAGQRGATRAQEAAQQPYTSSITIDTSNPGLAVLGDQPSAHRRQVVVGPSPLRGTTGNGARPAPLPLASAASGLTDVAAAHLTPFGCTSAAFSSAAATNDHRNSFVGPTQSAAASGDELHMAPLAPSADEQGRAGRLRRAQHGAGWHVPLKTDVPQKPYSSLQTIFRPFSSLRPWDLGGLPGGGPTATAEQISRPVWQQEASWNASASALGPSAAGLSPGYSCLGSRSFFSVGGPTKFFHPSLHARPTGHRDQPTRY